jgi:anti-anti-sigma factor
MKISDSIDGNFVVFQISGKISGTDSDTVAQFHEKVHGHIKAGRNHFIIDFGSVPMMTSIGIGMLTRCLTTVKTAEGDMALTGVENVERIIDMVGILRHFAVFDSIEEAKGSIATG